MGNTRNTGYLQNAIKVADNGNISLMHGSTMLMKISSSGAITTTGVISGSNALSASYAATASFVALAQTASFVALAQSASNAVAAQTASFANAFTVAGNLTAQTLVVQTITSSVDFVTGSTRFGSVIGNTHIFTGSMSVSGGLVVTTTSPELIVGATGVTLGNVITDAHNITGSVLVSGSFGLNKAVPQRQYTQVANANGIVFAIQNADASNEGYIVGFDATGSTYIQLSDSANAAKVYLNSSGSSYFTGGNVGIGTSSPSFKLDVQGTGRFTDTLTGISAIFAQSNVASVNVNSTNAASYSAFYFSENGTPKSYLEYINSAYTDTTRRNYLEVFNNVGAVSIWTNSIKALDIGTNQAATFSNTVQSTGQIVYSPTLGYVNTSYQSYAGATTWYVGAGSSGVSIQPFVIGRNLNGNSADFSISSTGVATFSGALNGTSGNFSSFVYIGGGNPLRIYNTGNGDYGNLTFATATGFTFDKGITSATANGFIGAYSTNPANDTRIGAYWADTSALEMRYNANSAVGYIQSLYENVGGQAFGDIHFRQNTGGGTMTTRMIIKNNNGGIGIGTTTPNNLLSVRGNADFGATGIAYAGMSQYGALTFPRGQIMWSNTNSQNQLYIAGNAYSNNNGVFAYRNSGQPATAIGLDNGGISFLTAGNGTADAAISWTSALGIYNAGYVTKPNNPAFRAYYSVNGYWALGSEAVFTFDSTEYNIGSCYNTSNGRFTAPVAGVYQFNFYTIIYGSVTNGAVSFRKNGGYPSSGYNIHFSPTNSSTSWSNVVYTTSIYLNAGDYVFMVNGSGATVTYHGDDWSSFSGYLVG
jgi:hypothetical protein